MVEDAEVGGGHQMNFKVALFFLLNGEREEHAGGVGGRHHTSEGFFVLLLWRVYAGVVGGNMRWSLKHHLWWASTEKERGRGLHLVLLTGEGESSSGAPLRSDTGKIVELDEHKDQIQSLTQGALVFHKNMGDVKTSESSDKEELYVDGRKISKYNNQETLLSDSGEVNNAKTTSSIGVLNATSIMAKAFGENVNVIASVVAETNQSAVDGVGNTSPRLHAARIRLRDPLPSAEFDRESKKLRLVCEFHAKGWCIRGSSCRFLHIKDGPDEVMKESEALGREAASSSARIPPLQSGKNPKLDSETEVLVLPKGDTFLGAPSWEDRGSFRRNLHLDNYRYYGTSPVKGSLSARDSTYLGSSSTTSHDNNRDTRVSGFGPTMDEIINKRSNIGSSTRLADLPYSHSRQPLPFGSSSWNNSAHVPHKFLESSLEHHTYLTSSMKQSTPPASRSESETLPRSHIFRDAEPAKYQTIISSFDWEPSVPFRPSHEIIRSIFFKERLCNPMRDRTDNKDVKDGRVKFSFSDQGSSIKNVNVQSNSPEEEKLLNTVNAGDAVNDNRLSSINDDNVQHDKQRDRAVLEVDGSHGTVKIDNIDDGFEGDDHVQSESKAFKYFQSALIESVKELVKPSWREGLLSKDAHKLIVKKAVDKVLSTLQPHQIPSTAESVKFYLCSSQPKLAKLVEGYLNIYGKT